MRPKKEILQDYFGVSVAEVARKIHDANFDNQRKTRPPLEQWITMKFPYEAPDHPPLPSIEEIEKAIKTDKLNYKVSFNWVCRVGECVVKFNDTVTLLQEAETLLYLQQHSKVRVPKLYAVYVEPRSFSTPEDEANMYYLVMEHIKGQVWDMEMYFGLDIGSQTKLCARLAEQFRLLRSIPQGSGYGDYYGHINYKGFSPHYTFLETRAKEMCGPYKTYADMVSDVQGSLERQSAMQDNREELSARDYNAFSKMKLGLSNSTYIRPTLTHMDPRPENIIIRQIDDANGEKDWDVTLIDWEHCGWMPAYMQAVAWEQAFSFSDDQEPERKFLEQILGPLDRYQAEMDLWWDVASSQGFYLL